MAVLHVTNGEAAAADLRSLGEVLTWDDVLHEGPVPALPTAGLRETRARFLAAAGFTDLATARMRLTARDERLDAVDFSTRVVLWFEDDLYDQLQLIQVLDRLASGGDAMRRSRPLGPVQLVVLPRGPRTFLRDRMAAACGLGEHEHELARRCWAAFTAPDPLRVQDAWLAGTPGLPDLAPALERLLEEHPATTDGLARTDREILEALAAVGGPAPVTAPELFTAVTARESRPFHGDATLWWRAERLAPLVDRTAGGAFALTEAGARVLAGEADAAALLAPLDRWVGGVQHLGAPAIRWDPAARRLRP